MKALKVLAGLVLALALVAPVAHAAEFMAANREGDGSLVIDSGSHRNLYLAGGNISVKTPVAGDLYVAGGNITINGDVEQDVMVAGGNITINGKVGGDVRAAGGSIVVNNTVGGDLLVAGGTITAAETASVGGDVATAGGVLTLDGSVAGAVRAQGGRVTINNSVGGMVRVEANQSLAFGSNAKVPGTITYRGTREASVHDGAQVSSINFNRLEHRRGRTIVPVIFGVGFLVKLLAWLIVAWLLVRFLPRRSRSVVEGVHQNPWMNLGIGFVGMIVIPVAIVLAFITLIGYYAALLVLAWFIFALLLVGPLTALLIGSYIDKWLLKRTELVLDWQAVVMGVVVMALLALVPLVGLLVIMILALMTFGSLLRTLQADIKANG